MAFRFLYRLPGLSPRVAKESPQFRRLLEQAPDGDDGVWHCWEHPDGGTLAVWPGSPTEPPAADSLGEGIQTEDGLVYYPCVEQPRLEDLIRPEISRPRDGCWVTLTGGIQLWVAVAVISEVKYALIATGQRRRIPVKHRYGILARELVALYNQKEPQPTADEYIAAEVKLIIAAIHASYQVTDEAIADIEAFQFTRQDMDMILYIAQGSDPKEFAAVLRASLCSQPAAESLTYPSLPENGGPLDNGQHDVAMVHG